MASSIFTPQYDANIRAEAATTNYGSISTVAQGWLTGKGAARANAILEFDISSLIGVTLSTAQLEVYVGAPELSGPVTRYCERMIRPTGYTGGAWTEAGVTWNKYDGTTDWSTAGGDRDTTAGRTAAWTLPVNATGWQTMIPTSNAEFLALLQYVLDTQSPAGIAAIELYSTSSGATILDFASSEAANPAKLTITYPDTGFAHSFATII